MSKKLIFLDLDDTVANFCDHPVFEGKYPVDTKHMYEPGFFLSLEVIEGAQVAIRQLIRLGYDVQILSQPVAESHHSYSEKVQWIALHFPELIGKINLTQDKGLFNGDYLIDDNEEKWKTKFEANGGRFVHFQYFSKHRVDGNNRSQWETIVHFFKMEKANDEEKNQSI